MADGGIRVLVADDSMVTRMFLVHLLESDPQIRVVGAVADGQAAVEFVQRERPDVVLMDIHMPRLDGFEATRRIMATQAVPIVICSATADARDLAITFRAMEAGAIACIEKPLGREHPGAVAASAHLLETVKLMSEVRVVRRTTRARPVPPPAPRRRADPPEGRRLVGIGASTGGPPVLQTILAGLSKDFPAPILVVQHIARGFLAGMAEWLDHTTGFRVQIASHGTVPLRGHVYLAPDDFHMGVTAGGAILLAREEPWAGQRPAVSYLFHSLADVYGAAAVGVLLTGMGRDGAGELREMRDRGAVTIAQDRETSVVHGMPGAAIALDGATHVLPACRVADMLTALFESRPAAGKERDHE